MSQRKEEFPLQYGANNPILRTVTQKVDPTNDDVQRVAKALSVLIHEYNGVWLAAPQIGQDMRIIAITERNRKGKKMLSREPVILINPIIIASSQKTHTNEEWCLSLPNLYGDVTRPAEITVEYQDIQGNTQTKKRSGFTSAIVQHEIDHLDGILFIDKE